MPDPMDELEHFTTPGLTMNPLPASEVRRRGTRMRRRNNALATLGGVAAVAIIATPIALAATGGDPSPAPTPPVASQPPAGWQQEIPADFDLTEGLADGAESSDEPGVPLLSLCDQTAFDADVQTVDIAGVIRRGAPNTDEPELSRTLALYPDATTAAQAVDRLRDALEACPSEAGAGGDTIRHELIASELDADESFLYTDSYVAAGEDFPQAISYYVVVRTGNAVLVTSDPSTVPWDEQVAREQERVADLVDAMQVFSAEVSPVEDPEASEGVEEPTGLTGAIPDTFPLAKGLPTDPQGGVGVEGPSHDLDLAPYNLENNLQACGAGARNLPEPVDTLNAGYRSPAMGILRQLRTFESAADAEAYAEGVVAPFAACPESDEGRGVTKVYEVTGEDAGDQASSAVMRVEVDGEPGIGYQLVQVVRVGQAVLQTLVVNDAEQLEQTPDELRTTYLDDSRSVIDELG